MRWDEGLRGRGGGKISRLGFRDEFFCLDFYFSPSPLPFLF